MNLFALFQLWDYSYLFCLPGLIYETVRCDLIVFLFQHSWRHQPTSGGLPGHGAAIEGVGGCGEMYYYTITAVWRI